MTTEQGLLPELIIKLYDENFDELVVAQIFPEMKLEHMYDEYRDRLELVVRVKAEYKWANVDTMP